MIHGETDAERIGGKPLNLFRLFVYGTLKRGCWNHEAYCGSAVSVEEATIRGRLYELPSGRFACFHGFWGDLASDPH